MNTSITQISQAPTIAPADQSASSSLLHDSRGLSTVEYIVLLVIVVVGCVALWRDIGGDLVDNLNDSHTELSNIQGAQPDL